MNLNELEKLADAAINSKEFDWYPVSNRQSVNIKAQILKQLIAMCRLQHEALTFAEELSAEGGISGWLAFACRMDKALAAYEKFERGE